MLLDQRERVHTVFALADQVDLLNALEQEGQLVARGLFVVDDDDVDGHFGCTLSIGKAANAGNSGRRKYARAGKHVRPEGVSYKILRGVRYDANGENPHPCRNARPRRRSHKSCAVRKYTKVRFLACGATKCWSREACARFARSSRIPGRSSCFRCCRTAAFCWCASIAMRRGNICGSLWPGASTPAKTYGMPQRASSSKKRAIERNVSACSWTSSLLRDFSKSACTFCWRKN